MKMLRLMLLSTIFAMPAYAQEPAADEAAAATAEPAAEASADAAPASDGSAATDAGAAPAEAAADTPTEPVADAPVDAPADAAATDSAASEVPADSSADSGSAPVEDNPYKLYAGVSYSKLKLLVSDSAMASRFGASRLSGTLALVRAGVRVFDVVGLEVQGGTGAGGSGTGSSFDSSSYFAAYIVPTGNLFDVVEIAAPVGYAMLQADRGNATQRFQGVSYGINVELPLRSFGEELPNLRFTGGYRVYYADQDARISGYQAGLRYDFTL